MNTIFKNLDNAREDIIHWQKELSSRPALGPESKGEGEALKAEFLIKTLKEMGFKDIQEYRAEDSRVPCGYRPNLSVKIKGKSPQTLWLISHMDVVPPGELKLWETNPYELKVDGDLIYARGVEDNQQGMVTGMLIAQSLIKEKITPDLSLGLLFVADEETGMTKGLPHVLKTAPELMSEDDLILVPDIGNSEGSLVQVAEKSCIWFRVNVLGKQCHASTPEKGLNSLIAASECVLAMQELYRIFRNKNKLFTPSWSTFVPTKKEANVENVNTIPGQDVFYIDCRVLPEYDLDDVERECRRIAEETAVKTGARIEVEVINRTPALAETPHDAPVVAKLLKALKELRQLKGIISGSGGQTVASILRNAGYNAVAWSTLMPNAHSPNEHSSISNTINDAKVVSRMLFK